jgi:hypothetical protein
VHGRLLVSLALGSRPARRSIGAGSAREPWGTRPSSALDLARELALFNLGSDSKLRGCDLVAPLGGHLVQSLDWQLGSGQPLTAHLRSTGRRGCGR